MTNGGEQGRDGTSYYERKTFGKHKQNLSSEILKAVT